MRKRLKTFIESKAVSNFILAVIIINSILLGMLTYPVLCQKFGSLMHLLCNICVVIFSIEILSKLSIILLNFSPNSSSEQFLKDFTY